EKAILVTSLSQEINIDETSKDKSIEDQKKALIANKNNNLTNELEETELTASTSVYTNIEKTLEIQKTIAIENTNQELVQDKALSMIIINNNNHKLQKINYTEGEYI
ncbi:10984_t:CDS:1, partial [Scutellospora calospora]